MDTNNRHNIRLDNTDGNNKLYEEAIELNKMKQIIENEMSEAYKKYGKESTVEVSVSADHIELWINSESPYMDKEFWAFLNETGKKIDNILLEHGFYYEKTKYFFDFVIWLYTRTNNDENNGEN